jgi:hypothetical protein
MNFGAVAAKYQLLQQTLAVQVGPRYPQPINVLPPSGERDELSFVRLVAWSYVLVHETGRIHLAFLSQLPPLLDFGPILPHVRQLRTWTSHQLSLEKDRDQAILAGAQRWFRTTCSVGTPSKPPEWNRCFKRLCFELHELIGGAILACEAFQSETDGPRLAADLGQRLDRNWEAYRFDKVVEAAAARLGYGGLDPVAFRTRHLDSWRKVVMIAQEAAIERLLELRVEADLLGAMNNALPTTAREVLQRIAPCSPAELAATMLVLKNHWNGDRDIEALLGALTLPRQPGDPQAR